MDGSVCFDGSQFPAPRRSRGVVHRAHFTAPEKRQNGPLGRDAEPPEVPHESGIGTDCVITNWTELLTADGSVFPNRLRMLQLSRGRKQAICGQSLQWPVVPWKQAFRSHPIPA
jgi:hypothetical protein